MKSPDSIFSKCIFLTFAGIYWDIWTSSKSAFSSFALRLLCHRNDFSSSQPHRSTWGRMSTSPQQYRHSIEADQNTNLWIEECCWLFHLSTCLLNWDSCLANLLVCAASPLDCWVWPSSNFLGLLTVIPSDIAWLSTRKSLSTSTILPSIRHVGNCCPNRMTNASRIPLTNRIIPDCTNRITTNKPLSSRVVFVCYTCIHRLHWCYLGIDFSNNMNTLLAWPNFLSTLFG